MPAARQTSAQSDPALAPERDGRRLRSQDSRARIVAAMLALVRAGVLAPSAEQVAEGAGVGLRSVFRHFKDMDSLYREMSQVVEGQLLLAYDSPFPEDWPARLAELVARRAAIFERISPFLRASDVSRKPSAALAEDKQRLATLFRERLERQLPPQMLAHPLRIEALDLLLSYQSWARLRGEQALSVERARQTLLAAARAVAGLD